MADTFRLTLAQLNPVMGDLEGNAVKAKEAWAEAKAAGSQLLALPEMFLLGYNAQDLVMKPALQARAYELMGLLAADCADGPAIAIGGPLAEGGQLFNAYYILSGGKIAHIRRKHHLPNYTVFDEERLFDHGPLEGPYDIDGVRIGSPICEDAWFEDVARKRWRKPALSSCWCPTARLTYRGKFERRMNHMVARVVETGLPLIYLNMVGGQDDQVFDGGSFILNPGGALALQLPLFDEALAHVTLRRTEGGWMAEDGPKASLPDEMEQDYRCMVQSLRDYCGKSGFQKVLLGLSGGIDSAIVCHHRR